MLAWHTVIWNEIDAKKASPEKCRTGKGPAHFSCHSIHLLHKTYTNIYQNKNNNEDLFIKMASTHQYCHIFLAWNGKLQTAKVSTTMISIRITPRRARNTLFDECDTWYICGPWWWCRWWKLCVRKEVVVTALSESTDTCIIWRVGYNEQSERKINKRVKAYIRANQTKRFQSEQNAFE